MSGSEILPGSETPSGSETLPGSEATQRFVLLTRESANRVYADQASALLTAELLAIAPTLNSTIENVAPVVFGNVEYVGFDAAALDARDHAVLSNLSCVRALFEVHDNALLAPLPHVPLAHFDSDLITIQRYPGKTNEQFTHLLVNLALAASRSASRPREAGERLALLDPVAGRGTTLNRALMYGFDAYGVEVAEADVDQYRTFAVTYLKDHRIKHKLKREQVKKGPLAGTSQFSIDIGSPVTQRVRVANGESAQTRKLFPGQLFDVVVGDLPYGVQHRAASAKISNRSSEQLLEESLGGWRAAMHPGAALGLSWNLKTMPRQKVIERLEAERFTVVEHPVSFEHVVDRSITRDLIVAVR